MSEEKGEKAKGSQSGLWGEVSSIPDREKIQKAEDAAAADAEAAELASEGLPSNEAEAVVAVIDDAAGVMEAAESEVLVGEQAVVYMMPHPKMKEAELSVADILLPVLRFKWQVILVSGLALLIGIWASLRYGETLFTDQLEYEYVVPPVPRAAYLQA